MNRRETTEYLSRLTEKYLNPNNDTRIYTAREVTFDYSTNHAVRVDYMKFEPVNNTAGGIEQGIVYCYEVKSCKEDFKSKHGHNFIGDFNYYVMTKELYEEVEIPWGIGVLCPRDTVIGTELVSVKKAQRKTRKRPVSEILLTMFRSANRELVKNRTKAVKLEYEEKYGRIE